MKRISISDEHGLWLGTCLMNMQGHITDCPVVLDPAHQSEQLYKEMEELISQGHLRGQVSHYLYEIYDTVD